MKKKPQKLKRGIGKSTRKKSIKKRATGPFSGLPSSLPANLADSTPLNPLCAADEALWQEAMAEITPKEGKNTVKPAAGPSSPKGGEMAAAAPVAAKTGYNTSSAPSSFTPSQEDIALFEAFMAGHTLEEVLEHGGGYAPKQKAPLIAPPQIDEEEKTAVGKPLVPAFVQAVTPESFFMGAPKEEQVDPLSFTVIENSAACLAGWVASLDVKVQKALRQGAINYTKKIDLHGFYLLEAYTALRLFLENAQKEGHRCVLITHGKGEKQAGGMGVIKQNLVGFLTTRAEVLAFHTAQPRDGGSGACYVLLRRLKR